MATLTVIRSDIFPNELISKDIWYLRAEGVDNLPNVEERKERAFNLIKELGRLCNLSDKRILVACSAWQRLGYSEYIKRDMDDEEENWEYIPEPQRTYYHEAYAELPKMSKGYYLAQKRKVESWAREDLATIKEKKLLAKKILQSQLSHRRHLRNLLSEIGSDTSSLKEEIARSLKVSKDTKDRLSRLLSDYNLEKSRIDKELRFFNNVSVRYATQ